jgi:hypothetical protein
MVEFTIQLTDKQFERLMERARQLGFARPEDYVVALINDVLGMESESNSEIGVTVSRREIQSDTPNP